MFRHSMAVNIMKANIDSVVNTRIFINCRPFSKNTSDCITSSHSVSNLRLIRFRRHENESETEKDYRLRRIRLQEWNHNYWLKNNNDFKTQKIEFIERELKGRNGQEFKPTLSYDELSVFYKRFLDSNHRKHMKYNLDWYKRHTSLLWPAFKVFLIRLKRNIISNKL